MLPFSVDFDKDRMTDIVRRWAERQADAPLFLQDDGAVMTYGELAGLMDEIGTVFDAAGVRPGQRVAAIQPSGLDLVALIYAVQDRATVAPMNVNAPMPSMIEDLKRRTVSWFIADAQQAAEIGNALNGSVETSPLPLASLPNRDLCLVKLCDRQAGGTSNRRTSRSC